MVSIYFLFYFLSLILFCLVNHPVYYCGLLVVNSFICSLICYSCIGFSWYSLLFCLIYVGGVYILFVFVSVHTPNASYVFWFNLSYISLILIIFVFIVFMYFYIYSETEIEFSSFLCNLSEGNFYVFMCLMLLFGFLILSLVMSVNINFYR